jgi:hypothetical protein
MLSDQFLYSWGTGKDIVRKVIVLSSCFPEDVDSIMRKSLAVSQIFEHFDLFASTRLSSMGNS